MAEKFPYWKSSKLFGAFLWKDGENGCEFCEDEELKLSLELPPPPLRDQPPPPKPVKAAEKEAEVKVDPWVNLFMVPSKVHAAFQKAHVWAATPEPPKVPKPLPPKVSKPVPAIVKQAQPFDIQQIPEVIRSRLGLPLGARMLQKWFDGEMNYANNSDDLQAEVNQRGEPYPASMIDRTSVKMKWVLSFERAEKAADELVNRMVTTEKARLYIRRKLHPYRHRTTVNTLQECNGDMQKMHRDFQFQFIGVEGSWSQKVEQFISREVSHRGTPDEMTFVLGAFIIYAAVGEAHFYRIKGASQVVVTHVNVYVRDSFDFFDPRGQDSQYLGHWNERGVAIVPLAQLKGACSAGDSSSLSRPARVDRKIMYCVRNRDFRNWREKHRQGGDYMIYTDSASRALAKPMQFIIPDDYEKIK